LRWIFQENNGVIVIGATNFADALDAALVRPGRFDRHIDVPLPDVGGRKAILELYAKKMPLSMEVDLEQIARGTPGFSGAELFNLMNQAAVKSSVNNEQAITMKALEWAKDRITMGAERQSAILTADTMKLTATHEAGHALVGLLTDGADPIHKATIIPRGRALGLVLQLPDGDQTSMTYKQMLARLDVCMGGRVAEQVVFGTDNVTSGASSDFQQATRLARMMVTKYGLSEKIGAIYIDNDTSTRDGSSHSISGEMQQLVDTEIKRLLDESYQRVMAMLTKNRSKLENIAAALVQYETLSGSEIVEILNTSTNTAGSILLKNRSEKPSREMKEIPLAGRKSINPQPAAGGPSKQPAAVAKRSVSPTKVTPMEKTIAAPQRPAALGSSNSNTSTTISTNDAHNVATSNGTSGALTPPPASPVTNSISDYFFSHKKPAPSAATSAQQAPSATKVDVPSTAAATTPTVHEKTVAVPAAPTAGAHTATTSANPTPTRPRVRGPPVIVSDSGAKASDVSNNKDVK